MADDSFQNQVSRATRTLDEHGKRVWREHGDDFREGGRRAGYVGAVIGNFIGLYILNNLLAWHVPFLTDGFIAPLAIMNLSLLATVAANVLFLIYDPQWFRLAAQVGLNVIALAATYTLFIIFPFDFGSTGLEIAARIGLIGVMIALGIGTIVEFCRLIFGLHGD